MVVVVLVVVFVVVLVVVSVVCRSSLFFLRVLKPFSKFLSKNRVFCRRGFSKPTFSLKIGFAPKRPFDNFAPGKKKGRFQGTPFLGIESVFSFPEKMDETNRNVVYSVSAPKTKFRLYQIECFRCSSRGVRDNCLKPLFL